MCSHRIGLAKFKVQNGANPEKKENNMTTRVTFRIVPTTDEIWQARIDLSESVCI